jgi:hypothetical protein
LVRARSPTQELRCLWQTDQTFCETRVDKVSARFWRSWSDYSPETAFEELGPALSPSVYQRVRRGDPKFWPSDGSLGSNYSTFWAAGCRWAGYRPSKETGGHPILRRPQFRQNRHCVFPGGAGVFHAGDIAAHMAARFGGLGRATGSYLEC